MQFSRLRDFDYWIQDHFLHHYLDMRKITTNYLWDLKWGWQKERLSCNNDDNDDSQDDCPSVWLQKKMTMLSRTANYIWGNQDSLRDQSLKILSRKPVHVLSRRHEFIPTQVWGTTESNNKHSFWPTQPLLVLRRPLDLSSRQPLLLQTWDSSWRILPVEWSILASQEEESV